MQHYAITAMPLSASLMTACTIYLWWANKNVLLNIMISGAHGNRQQNSYYGKSYVWSL